MNRGRTLVGLGLLFLMTGCVQSRVGQPADTDCRLISNACSNGFVCVRQEDGRYGCNVSDGDDRDMGPLDCRGTGCPSGTFCIEITFEEFACQPDNSCTQNNGGCGDREFVDCFPAVGGGVECVDIPECAENNGLCGDPSAFFCVENQAGPPECIPLEQATAPEVVGSSFFALTYRRDGVTRHCTLTWLGVSDGLADTGGGCEDCSFAWDLRFEGIGSTCPDEIERSVQETFSLSLGVDYVSDRILGLVEGEWIDFGDEGAYARSNSAAVAFTRPEIFHIDPNENGVVDPGETEIVQGVMFYGLAWEAINVTCGDGYCDFLEFGCADDCPDGQQPASGFVLRSFAYAPQDTEFFDCHRIERMSMVSGERPGGCDACTDTWLGETEVVSTDCGARGRGLGVRRRTSFGAMNGDELFSFSSSRGDWLRVSGEQAFDPDLRTLFSAGAFVAFGDRDDDGERDADEPQRIERRNVLIHF